MKEEGRQLGFHELMNIAAKTDALARKDGEESKVDRINGRLARDPHDVGALSYAMVAGAKNSNAFSLEIPDVQCGWFLLQISMAQVSYAMWEQLWNDAHPDRFGEAWDGEDFALMSVWRKRVQTMIRECHQEAILEMSAEEYFAQLKTAGESEEVAETLVDWISVIHEEDTPST